MLPNVYTIISLLSYGHNTINWNPLTSRGLRTLNNPEGCAIVICAIALSGTKL